jgi:hypothetical protein
MIDVSWIFPVRDNILVENRLSPQSACRQVRNMLDYFPVSCT